MQALPELVSPAMVLRPPPARAQRAPTALRLPEINLLVKIVDLILVNLVLFGYVLATIGLSVQPAQAALWSLVLSIVWVTVSLSLRAYDLRSLVPARSAWVAGKCALLTGFLYMMIPYATPVLPDRRLVIFLYPLLMAACLVPWRLLTASLVSRPRFRQRSVLVGKGPGSDSIALECASAPGFSEAPPYELIGFVGSREEAPAGLPVLGPREELQSICAEFGVDEVVVADDAALIKGDYLRAVLGVHEAGVQVITASQFNEMITGRVSISFEEGNLYHVLPLFRGPSHRVYLAFKRWLDALASLAGCVFVLLVAPLVALANLLLNPGPLFYRQSRVGLGGERFFIHKFRSMKVGAEAASGAVFCAENDPRVTPFGGFLRRTRIDELPQFFNVLMGHMSLVGPRPERPEFVAGFNESIPFYRARHSVRPGVTGWAQVEFRYGCSEADTLKKLQYDMFYVKHQSLYFDYLILLRTVQVVLGLKGR